MNYEDIEILAPSFSDFKLNFLNLNNNYLQDYGVQYLVQSLEKSTIKTLEILKMCDNRVTNEGALKMVEFLKNSNHNLQILGILQKNKTEQTIDKEIIEKLQKILGSENVL